MLLSKRKNGELDWQVVARHRWHRVEKHTEPRVIGDRPVEKDDGLAVTADQGCRCHDQDPVRTLVYDLPQECSGARGASRKTRSVSRVSNPVDLLLEQRGYEGCFGTREAGDDVRRHRERGQ